MCLWILEIKQMTMEGLFDLYNIPIGQSRNKGDVVISTFEFKASDDPLFNLRAIRDSGGMTAMDDGKFVRLVIGRELVMSDTRMERNSNWEFCSIAHGRVLIAGLGLGLILHNLQHPERIQEITIIEKSQDVIDLVSPLFLHLPIKYIHADILEWKPQKGEKFDVIYFDIWSTITEENLTEIRLLHNRFKHYLNREGGQHWMNSWMKEFLQQQRARERRSNDFF